MMSASRLQPVSKVLSEFLASLLVMLAVCLSPAPAQGDFVLLSDLAASGNKTATLSTSGTTSGAAGFTMGSGVGTSVNLTSFTARLGNWTGNASVSVQLMASTVNGTTGLPNGSVLQTLTSSTTLSGPGLGSYTDFTFAANGTFTLAANTTYWLVINLLSGSPNIVWRADQPPTTFSSNAGTQYAQSATRNSGIWTGFSDNLIFSVSGTPEPATWLTGGLIALCGTIVAIRGRRRATRDPAKGAA